MDLVVVAKAVMGALQQMVNGVVLEALAAIQEMVVMAVTVLVEIKMVGMGLAEAAADQVRVRLQQVEAVLEDMDKVIMVPAEHIKQVGATEVKAGQAVRLEQELVIVAVVIMEAALLIMAVVVMQLSR